MMDELEFRRAAEVALDSLKRHLIELEEEADAGFEVRGQIARVVRTMRGGDRPKGAHKRYRTVSVTPRCCWEPWLIFRKPCAGRVRDNLRKWSTGALRRPSTNVPFSDLIASGRAPIKEREDILEQLRKVLTMAEAEGDEVAVAGDRTDAESGSQGRPQGGSAPHPEPSREYSWSRHRLPPARSRQC